MKGCFIRFWFNTYSVREKIQNWFLFQKTILRSFHYVVKSRGSQGWRLMWWRWNGIDIWSRGSRVFKIYELLVWCMVDIKRNRRLGYQLIEWCKRCRWRICINGTRVFVWKNLFCKLDIQWNNIGVGRKIKAFKSFLIMCISKENALQDSQL